MFKSTRNQKPKKTFLEGLGWNLMGIAWRQGTVAMTAAFGEKKEEEKSSSFFWKAWALGSSGGGRTTECPSTGPRRRQRTQGSLEETGDPTSG